MTVMTAVREKLECLPLSVATTLSNICSQGWLPTIIVEPSTGLYSDKLRHCLPILY